MRTPTSSKLAALALTAAAACAPVAALAQSTTEDLSDSGDTAWLLTSAALVLLLALPGLALVYAGRVRSSSALTVAAQIGVLLEDRLQVLLLAVVGVGAEPGYITVTPDNSFALVLNRKSGDMAVLRVGGIQRNRQKLAGLFTMIPVGSSPVSAAIRMV